MNPYEVLGISEDATAMQIKVAYRKLAHLSHPDRPGGDKEKFTLVSKAYEILSDPKKREQYDRTGKIGEDTTDYEASAAQTLRNLFKMSLGSGASNIVLWCRTQLAGSINNSDVFISETEKGLSAIKKLRNRAIRKSGGPNLFTEVLDEKVKEISDSLAGMRTGKKITVIALELLDDYEHSAEVEQYVRINLDGSKT